MADDYISRKLAKLAIINSFQNGKGYVEALNDVPAADVRPVVKAEFVPARDGYFEYVMCTHCYAMQYKDSNFCPNCGADMRTDEATEDETIVEAEDAT